MDEESESVEVTTESFQEQVSKVDESAPGIPEKFRNEDGTVNTDALLKSYTELEKMRGAPKAETPATDLSVAKKVEEKSDPKALLGDDLYTEIEQVYAENGAITEDVYAKLAEKGVSRKFADAFIEGQKVISSKYESDATASVGGIEQYQKMQEWAKEGLSSEEIDMVNEAVTSGNATRAKMAVEFLRGRFVTSEGSEPNLVEGSSPARGSGFANREEYAAAISDPKYGKDPRYTREVETQLANSSYWR